MVSDDKLIKTGIRYTDRLFEEIKRRLTHDIDKYDNLEDYLAAHTEYTVQNPLVVTGYSEVMQRLVLQSTNNIKYSSHAQRKLTQIVIENTVGNLIANVGEDIKQSVRDIVKTGFEEHKAPRDIAKDIETKVDSINSTRAKAIARTEVKRANTVSSYIVNKERGATAYYVDCHPEACELCVELYGEGENAPGDDKGHDNIYPIDDTEHLPPVHPNCRCSATYVKAEPNVTEETDNEEDNDDYS